MVCEGGGGGGWKDGISEGGGFWECTGEGGGPPAIPITVDPWVRFLPIHARPLPCGSFRLALPRHCESSGSIPAIRTFDPPGAFYIGCFSVWDKGIKETGGCEGVGLEG